MDVREKKIVLALCDVVDGALIEVLPNTFAVHAMGLNAMHLASAAVRALLDAPKDIGAAQDDPESTISDDAILHFACGHSARFAGVIWNQHGADGNPAIGSECGHLVGEHAPLCYSALVRIEDAPRGKLVVEFAVQEDGQGGYDVTEPVLALCLFECPTQADAERVIADLTEYARRLRNG